MSINFFNIQGLTRVKAVEIGMLLFKKCYDLFDGNSTKSGKDEL